MVQMIDFISEKINDFAEFVGSKKYVALSIIILIFLSLCALIVFVVYLFSSGTKSSAPQALPITQNFEGDQPLLLPEGPEISDSYVLSRQPNPFWTNKEEKLWFTTPDAESLEDLKKADDGMINDILGAAP